MKIKIPKLKRWQKVLRNVSLSIILILLIFISIDFRWLTSDLAFENLTKAYLIDDYDIIATFKEEIQGIQKGEKAYLAETSDYYLYGTVYKSGLLWEERQLFLNKKEPYVLISLSNNNIFSDNCTNIFRTQMLIFTINAL